ncbi:MAG: endonuclease/exonuclease/phosphatase family protein [Paludibacteraceae bacterium]|nr:endonuclease/exonuclease/phosphatase family protein [Paludibacteraceae bacterium]
MKCRTRNSVLWCLAGVVLAAVCVGVWSCHQPRPDTSHRLTVLTWNTERMGNFAKPDKNEVLRYLMAQDADVICLQEVDVYKRPQFLTLQEVKDVLGSKYRYSYLDFSVYDSRHQFGTMVWSQYPLINKQSIHYETRGNISNRCDIVVEGDTLRLINNHLESYSFTSEDLAEMDSLHNYEGLRASAKRLEAKWRRAVPLRNAQARVIRSEIEASPYPVIVVGDFNAMPLSYAYRHIRQGLHDAWRANHLGYGATCEHRGIGLRIDYILSSESIIPTSCTIQETTGSDHKPVVATLEW